MEKAAEYTVDQSDIERRVRLTLLLSQYVRTTERFNQVSQEFQNCTKPLKKELRAGERFVTHIDHKHYLVTVDDDGRFDVEPVKVI